MYLFYDRLIVRRSLISPRDSLTCNTTSWIIKDNTWYVQMSLRLVFTMLQMGWDISDFTLCIWEIYEDSYLLALYCVQRMYY